MSESQRKRKKKESQRGEDKDARHTRDDTHVSKIVIVSQRVGLGTVECDADFSGARPTEMSLWRLWFGP